MAFAAKPDVRQKTPARLRGHRLPVYAAHSPRHCPAMCCHSHTSLPRLQSSSRLSEERSRMVGEANDRLTRAENDGLGVVNPCVRVDEDAPRRGCCKRRRVLGPRRSGRRRSHRATTTTKEELSAEIFAHANGRAAAAHTRARRSAASAGWCLAITARHRDSCLRPSSI